MKVDFNYKFKEIDGKPSRELVIDEDEKGNPKRDTTGSPLLKLGPIFTLRSACLNVLQNPPVEVDPRTGREVEVSAEEKLGWADLAMRVYKGGLVDLSAEEVVLLKKFLNKRYRNPLVIRQAYDALDPTAAGAGKNPTSQKKRP